jgi:hypothetical protein
MVAYLPIETFQAKLDYAGENFIVKSALFGLDKLPF